MQSRTAFQGPGREGYGYLLRLLREGKVTSPRRDAARSFFEYFAAHVDSHMIDAFPKAEALALDNLGLFLDGCLTSSGCLRRMEPR